MDGHLLEEVSQRPWERIIIPEYRLLQHTICKKQKKRTKRKDRVAREGEETRAHRLGRQVMRDQIYFIFSTTLSREQKAKQVLYLYFTNVKRYTQKSLETWPRLCGEQRQDPNPGLLTASSKLKTIIAPKHKGRVVLSVVGVSDGSNLTHSITNFPHSVKFSSPTSLFGIKEFSEVL